MQCAWHRGRKAVHQLWIKVQKTSEFSMANGHSWKRYNEKDSVNGGPPKSEYRGNTSNEFYRYEQNLPSQFSLSNHDPSDSLLAVLAVISYCKRLLTNSPLARACAPIIGQRNVEQLVKICVRDIRVNMKQDKPYFMTSLLFFFFFLVLYLFLFFVLVWKQQPWRS